MRQVSSNSPHPKTRTSQPTGVPLKVPFGLKLGRMWSPKQVPSGLGCGCICPACRAPLVAKAADSTCRRPHFAHLAETDCRAGYETALHLKAKELLADHALLVLPAWDGEPAMANPPTLVDDEGVWWTGTRIDFPIRKVALHNVRLEEARGDYTPDVVATDDQGELLIEIRVSHAVDALKRRRIQSEGQRLVEIDLSKLPTDALLDEAQLVQQVLYEPSNRYWLSCPKATELWREAQRALKQQIAEQNELIAQKRKAHETAQLALQQAQRAQQAENAQKRINAERFREEQRAPYRDALEELPELVSFERIQAVLERYWTRDRPQIERLLTQIPSEQVREAIRGFGPDTWLYQVHPSLWQAASYQRFVLGQEPGNQFNQQDVARWVMQHFGRDETLFSLFRAQYQFRDRARKAGYNKRRISFWAFTDLENQQVPNFYKPINAFFDRLVHLGALRRVPDQLGELSVLGKNDDISALRS